LARVLVTGARGFIGQQLVRALVHQSANITCLDRSPTAPDALSKLPVRRLHGDVRDAAAMERAVRKVDCIFHLAGATAPRSLVTARAVNVHGSWNIASAAARQTTPPKIIYVSSLAVAGPGAQAVTETSACHPVSIYGQTKLEAEEALAKWSLKLPVTIVRPPGVFGTGDRNLLRLFQSVLRGWNFHCGRTFRYSLLHVDDLVPALLAAETIGQRLRGEDDPERAGVYYVADAEAVSFPELASRIARCLECPEPRQVRVPPLVGWTGATCGEFVQWALGRRVYFNRDKAREAYGGSWICDPARAEKELRFSPAADLTERLEQTRIAYEQAGWLMRQQRGGEPKSAP